MSCDFCVVIPVRYTATRLPGKPLLEINNKPLLQHVYETALNSSAKNIIIATDDDRVEQAAKSFGARVFRSISEHASGTDRVAEVSEQLKFSDEEIIVNLQGDEFGLEPTYLDRVATILHENPTVSMSTLATPVTSQEEYNDKNTVKVVVNDANSALYFSRSSIPSGEANEGQDAHSFLAKRHIGLYAYRASFLKLFVKLPPCELEQLERLEQLRALFNGYQIQVGVVESCNSIGVDTQEDLEKARRF